MLSGEATKLIIIDGSPDSYEYMIGPFSANAPENANREMITLEPGIYKIVAKVDKTGVSWYYGETTFEGDNKYTDWFYIKTQFS